MANEPTKEEILEAVGESVYQAVSDCFPWASKIIEAVYDATFQASLPKCATEHCTGFAANSYGRLDDVHCIYHRPGGVLDQRYERKASA